MRINKLTTAVRGVAALGREAFSADRHSFLIHCQSGFDQFLEAHLLPDSLDTGRTYWVATDEGGNIAGFAEFRREAEESYFLNHLCVHPSQQGRGLGRALIGAAIEEWEREAVLTLDVFSDAPAKQFYESLGFVHTQTRTWLIDNDPALRIASRAGTLINNAAEFFASMRTYGFGAMEVGGPSGRIGRVQITSGSVARIEAADSQGRLLLKNVAATVVPGLTTWVTIACIDSRTDAPDALVEATWVSERMQAKCRALRDQLNARDLLGTKAVKR